VEVTDVLRERMQEPGGLRLTSLVSLLFHSLLAAGLIYGPIRWLPHPAAEDKPVMTITLGGAGTGPKSGGLTAIGGRPIQTTEPPPLKAEPIRAPAAKVPEMTTPTARPSRPRPTEAGAPSSRVCSCRGAGKHRRGGSPGWQCHLQKPAHGARVRAGQRRRRGLRLDARCRGFLLP
jgi:hypothetical protein